MLITRDANAQEICIDMENNFTAVIKQDGDWWIGWIEEVPGVNCQEKSREELLETLQVTLREALEFNRQDALDNAGTNYEEIQIAA
jgi:predicted RNase H-like HicB family nuclease